VEVELWRNKDSLAQHWSDDYSGSKALGLS